MPQPADLLPAARAEDGDDAVSFLAQARRISVPRVEREPGRAARGVRHDRRARPDLPEETRHRAAAGPEAAAAAPVGCGAFASAGGAATNGCSAAAAHHL